MFWGISAIVNLDAQGRFVVSAGMQHLAMKMGLPTQPFMWVALRFLRKRGSDGHACSHRRAPLERCEGASTAAEETLPTTGQRLLGVYNSEVHAGGRAHLGGGCLGLLLDALLLPTLHDN
jgi:hypothetical protein